MMRSEPWAQSQPWVVGARTCQSSSSTVAAWRDLGWNTPTARPACRIPRSCSSDITRSAWPRSVWSRACPGRPPRGAYQVLDLLSPIFVLLGIEHVEVAPGDTAFTPLRFASYPGRTVSSHVDRLGHHPRRHRPGFRSVAARRGNRRGSGREPLGARRCQPPGRHAAVARRWAAPGLGLWQSCR